MAFFLSPAMVGQLRYQVCGCPYFVEQMDGQTCVWLCAYGAVRHCALWSM